MTVRWKSNDIFIRVRAGAVRGVTTAIGIVEQRAVDLILKTPKTGKTYRRRGVKHQASAPYEPFASDTGTTIKARQIVVAVGRGRGAKIVGRLTFSTKNAARLEYGTKRMAPRPFARRAISETRQQVIDEIARAIKGSLDQVGPANPRVRK